MYLLEVSPVLYVYFPYERLTNNGYSDLRRCMGKHFVLGGSAPDAPFSPGSFDCHTKCMY